MADEIEFEEEELTTKCNGQTMLRILAQARPHWKWVAGFLVTITFVAGLDSYFTFLRKQLIDQGITPGDTAALARIGAIYAVMIVFQAAGAFIFIYLAGVLGERISYDLR